LFCARAAIVGGGVAELISLIVATYNRPDALGAVLGAFARQSDRDFEIVVADDGSGPATRELVAAQERRLDVPLKHVWHEDCGFRLAAIRNRAIAASRGRYCIFLDGDCIPRPDYVAVHRHLARPGRFVTGNRVLLARELTERVLAQSAEPERWGLATWAKLRAQGQINRLAPLVPLPTGPLRRLRGGAWRGARACNLAVWRSDVDRVDGFDAAFCGWGREDSDFLIRLLRTGVRRTDGNFATGVLHLWHPESDRAALPENERRLDEVVRSERVRARDGLSRFGADARGAPAAAGADGG
jgi:glycosyltransferase involved in cell wall biosynthesis